MTRVPEPDLPQIPECDVERTEAGLFRVTHLRTHDTDTADSAEQAVIVGMVLRVSAAWRSPSYEVPFTTGDSL